MASIFSPAFGYTVVYVKDVAKSVAFYTKAFGYCVRRLDESHKWGELESGQTTIAFTPFHQHETDDFTGLVHTPGSGRQRNQVEVCLDYPDVDAAYKVLVAGFAFVLGYCPGVGVVGYCRRRWCDILLHEGCCHGI
ncbi:unnamed protein product [Camellia sinensis]